MIANAKEMGRNDWVLLGLVGLALFALYFPFLTTLFADWGRNDDYSHGYFIPVLTGYFLYTMRERLGKVAIAPNTFGLVLIVLGLAQLTVAKIGSEYFLQRTSLIVCLFGLVLFFLGWQFLKVLFFPLGYLFFMVPIPAIIWNKISFPMQLFSSFLTEHVVRLLGIPIFREGNVIHLAQTTLEVVAACSGLRSLVTMFALSGAMAILSTMSTGKRLLLFVAAVPIAIFANIFRLTTTAILATQMGSAAAQGFLHELSGMVVFMLGLALLLLVNWLLGGKMAGQSTSAS